jgi:HSP20 family molecular chaperone IbpA
VASQSRSGYPLLDAFQEFERAFDELFEDLLISRWRCAGRSQGRAQVLDLGDKYEVQIVGLQVESGKVEIEATDRRLILRVIGPKGKVERFVDFQQPIDADAVSAHMEEGRLKITLPKKPVRKIKIS